MEKKGKPVISFKNVSVEYRAYKKNRHVFLSELLGLKRGTVQTVLKDISFDIYKGEKVALIGKRGIERDVVIELLAGLTYNTGGKVSVKGNVASALAFSIGFDYAMDMSDNIELKGYRMGWSKAKVRDSKERIIERAGLTKKIKYKLKDLKPTDIARLGFYMFAEQNDADIYIIGCPLMVGDSAQRNECMKVLKEMTGGPDKTLVIANKYAQYGQQLCERGIAFYEKKLVYDGDVKECTKYYLKNCKEKPKPAKKKGKRTASGGNEKKKQ